MSSTNLILCALKTSSIVKPKIDIIFIAERIYEVLVKKHIEIKKIPRAQEGVFGCYAPRYCMVDYTIKIEFENNNQSAVFQNMLAYEDLYLVNIDKNIVYINDDISDKLVERLDDLEIEADLKEFVDDENTAMESNDNDNKEFYKLLTSLMD